MSRRIDIAQIRVGGIARAASARIEVSESVPPAFYNEATLLEDMLNAHRHAESEADETVLRATNGIGTARTRSEGIVDLIRNNSLIRTAGAGRTLPALSLSDAGRALVRALPAELKSVGLTAKWELLLRRVERGQVPASEFKRRNEIFVGLVVKEAKRQKELQESATTPSAVAENQHTV